MKKLEQVKQRVLLFDYEGNGFEFNCFGDIKRCKREVKLFVKQLSKLASGLFFDVLKEELNKR